MISRQAIKEPGPPEVRRHVKFLCRVGPIAELSIVRQIPDTRRVVMKLPMGWLSVGLGMPSFVHT